MKFKYWLTLSIVFLSVIGCTNSPTHQSISTTKASVDASDNSQKQESIKSGTFASGEQATSGTVRLVTQDGKSSLELERNFKTSTSGPDLVVILHRSNNVLGSTQPPAYPIKEGDYVVLAPLKKFSGAQSYTIPESINLADYQSVAIWCRKFNATFGAAVLR